MGTLNEDIEEQSNWIVKAFAADRHKLDFTIESFISIDRFIIKHSKNGKPKAGGRLDKNLGPVLFSLASYIGETIIRNVPGSVWVNNDEDPDGELTVSIKLPDGTFVYPAQKIMKRYKNGIEDAIYPYGHIITKNYTNKEFKTNYWDMIKQKPWWRFW